MVEVRLLWSCKPAPNIPFSLFVFNLLGRYWLDAYTSPMKSPEIDRFSTLALFLHDLGPETSGVFFFVISGGFV